MTTHEKIQNAGDLKSMIMQKSSKDTKERKQTQAPQETTDDSYIDDIDVPELTLTLRDPKLEDGKTDSAIVQDTDDKLGDLTSLLSDIMPFLKSSSPNKDSDSMAPHRKSDGTVSQAIINGVHKVTIASVVRGLEEMMKLVNDGPTNFNKANIVGSLHKLVRRLNVISETVHDERGKKHLLEALEAVKAISSIVMDELQEPVMDAQNRIMTITTDTASKLVGNMAKFANRSVLAIPVVGTVAAAAQNILTVVQSGTATAAALAGIGETVSKTSMNVSNTFRGSKLRGHVELFKSAYSNFLKVLSNETSRRVEGIDNFSNDVVENMTRKSDKRDFEGGLNDENGVTLGMNEVDEDDDDDDDDEETKSKRKEKAARNERNKMKQTNKNLRQKLEKVLKEDAVDLDDDDVMKLDEEANEKTKTKLEEKLQQKTVQMTKLAEEIQNLENESETLIAPFLNEDLDANPDDVESINKLETLKSRVIEAMSTLKSSLKRAKQITKKAGELKEDAFEDVRDYEFAMRGGIRMRGGGKADIKNNSKTIIEMKNNMNSLRSNIEKNQGTLEVILNDVKLNLKEVQHARKSTHGTPSIQERISSKAQEMGENIQDKLQGLKEKITPSAPTASSIPLVEATEVVADSDSNSPMTIAKPITEPTTEPTTESTTEPTAEPTAEPITERTDVPQKQEVEKKNLDGGKHKSKKGGRTRRNTQKSIMKSRKGHKTKKRVRFHI